MWLAPTQLGSIMMHHAPEHSQWHSSADNQLWPGSFASASLIRSCNCWKPT